MRMRWAGYSAHLEEIRNAYTILDGMPEWKRALERHRRRFEDNISMDFKECLNWIYVAQDRVQWRVLVNTAMNLPVL
jgi:hypothetical protein